MREMKDSGIEWIGEIPKSWKICRLKDYAHICNGRDYSEVLDENGEYPVIGSGGQFENASKALYSSESVLLGRKGTIDKPIYINQPFWTVDTMYYTEIKENTWAKYFYYLCTQIEFDFYQYGSAVPSMTQRDLYNVNFPYPTIEEQQRIADYLDRKCSQIDTIIARQQEVIEKLKAYKLSVITEAVTKGLNPDAPMKDSGIDFIGQIPAHWTLNKFKYLSLDIGDGIHTTPTYDTDGKIYFVNGNNIGNDNLVFKEGTNTINEVEYATYKHPLLTQNTIFITLNGATYGKTSFYHGEKILLGKSAGFITLKPTENKEYIRYYLQSNIARLIMDLSLLGSTIANLSLRTLNDFLIPYPPIEEQQVIVNYLTDRTNSLDTAISRKQTIIDKLTDYKKSLIYEVVTGKKEV